VRNRNAALSGTLAATVYLYLVIPKGFFPQQDNATIQGTTEAGQDISYAAMVERVHERGSPWPTFRLRRR
jgi:multidrug efflux pump